MRKVNAVEREVLCTCGHKRAQHCGEQFAADCGACFSGPKGWTFCKCKGFKPAAPGMVRPVEPVKALRLTQGTEILLDEIETREENDMKSKSSKKSKSEKKGRTPALAGLVDKAFDIFIHLRGKEYKARVYATGMIEYNGKEYTSPSAAAMAINGSKTRMIDGWHFFNFNRNGQRVRLNVLRGRKSPLECVEPDAPIRYLNADKNEAKATVRTKAAKKASAKTSKPKAKKAAKAHSKPNGKPKARKSRKPADGATVDTIPLREERTSSDAEIF